MPKCSWVLRPATKELKAIYCGEAVGYTNPIHPDSGQRERKYETFCPAHKAESDKMDEDDA